MLSNLVLKVFTFDNRFLKEQRRYTCKYTHYIKRSEKECEWRGKDSVQLFTYKH